MTFDDFILYSSFNLSVILTFITKKLPVKIKVLTGTSYLGGGEGTIFRNAKDPYFIATQEPEVTGKPCGVIYQIRNTNKGMIDAKQLGNVQRNYKVSFNATGDIKASVKNVYNTSVKQRISGEFYY